MKKLIFLFLIINLPLFAQDRVKVASTANPSQNKLSQITTDSTLNNLTVPGLFSVTGNYVGMGTDNLLNNQTLTGPGSVITQALGDARYVTNLSGASGILPIANGGTGTNGARLPGTWTNLANFVVSSNLTVNNLSVSSNAAIAFSLVSSNRFILKGTGFTGGTNFIAGNTPGTWMSNFNGTNTYLYGSLKVMALDDGGGLSFNFPRAYGIGIVGNTADTDGVAQGDLTFNALSNTGDAVAEGRIALIRATLSGATAGNRGGAMEFYTKPNNASVPVLRMTIKNNAEILGGTSASLTNFSGVFTSLKAINNSVAWRQSWFPASLADGSFYNINPTRAMYNSTPAITYTNGSDVPTPIIAIPASTLKGKSIIIRTLIATQDADVGNIVVIQGVSSITNLAANVGISPANSSVGVFSTVTNTMPATAFGMSMFVSTNTVPSNAIASSLSAYPKRNEAGDTYTSNVFLISIEAEEIIP